MVNCRSWWLELSLVDLRICRRNLLDSTTDVLSVIYTNVLCQLPLSSEAPFHLSISWDPHSSLLSSSWYHRLESRQAQHFWTWSEYSQHEFSIWTGKLWTLPPPLLETSRYHRLFLSSTCNITIANKVPCFCWYMRQGSAWNYFISRLLCIARHKWDTSKDRTPVYHIVVSPLSIQSLETALFWPVGVGSSSFQKLCTTALMHGWCPACGCSNLVNMLQGKEQVVKWSDCYSVLLWQTTLPLHHHSFEQPVGFSSGSP